MGFNAQKTVFDVLSQYLSFFIMLVIYCKNKGQCHSRQLLRCVICVLRRKVLSLQTHREASSLHMHIFHHLAKMTANKPVYWHETTWMLFLGHWGHLFFPFFIGAGQLGYYTGLNAWCVTEGLRVFILMSVQRCRKTEDKEQRECSWSPFVNVKQFTKSGIKSSIVGQNMCLLASESISKGHKHPPTHTEGLKYNILPFLYFNVMADEILRGSKFTLWWLVIIWEMYIKRGHCITPSLMVMEDFKCHIIKCTHDFHILNRF